MDLGQFEGGEIERLRAELAAAETKNVFLSGQNADLARMLGEATAARDAYRDALPNPIVLESVKTCDSLYYPPGYNQCIRIMVDRIRAVLAKYPKGE